MLTVLKYGLENSAARALFHDAPMEDSAGTPGHRVSLGLLGLGGGVLSCVPRGPLDRELVHVVCLKLARNANTSTTRQTIPSDRLQVHQRKVAVLQAIGKSTHRVGIKL